MSDRPSPPSTGWRLSDTGTGSRLKVRVIPRARRSEIAGLRHDALLCRVAAPPVDGSANDELQRLLMTTLDVPRSAIRIVSGQRAREKMVDVEGLSPSDIRTRLRVEAG